MIKFNPETTMQPSSDIQDVLTAVLKKGAQELLLAAVQAEISTWLEKYEAMKLPNGRQVVVKNGYLPERTIQTGIGDIAVKVPKTRDRSGSGIHFTSALLPPYLK